MSAFALSPKTISPMPTASSASPSARSSGCPIPRNSWATPITSARVGGPIPPLPWLPSTLESSLARTSPRTGAASASSGRLRLNRRTGIVVWRSGCSAPRWIFSSAGIASTWVCLPSRRVPSTCRSIRSLGSGPAICSPSWPRRSLRSRTKAIPVRTSSRSAIAALFSQASPASRPQLLLACREVTSANFDGLDVQREIRAVAAQNLGDTVLIEDKSKLIAFAVCHAGAGSEAGTGICYVKFAAVRPGFAAAEFSSASSARSKPLPVSAGAQQDCGGRQPRPPRSLCRNVRPRLPHRDAGRGHGDRRRWFGLQSRRCIHP